MGIFDRVLIGFFAVIAALNAAHSQEQLPVFDEMVILTPLPLKHDVRTIKKNSSVHEALIAADVESSDIYQIVRAAKPQFNLRHVQPGTRFVVSREPTGDIKRVTFDIGPLSRLEIEYSFNEWISEIVDIETTSVVEHHSGVIQDSLWSSASSQGLSPEIITDFAEVFGWQVDFNREVRKGDLWRFSVEKLFAEGRHVGFGNIIYAEYKNGPELYKAYFYKDEKTSTQGYFDENGDSLRKVFLKSPIKFGRITSGFSRRRFHPIQKRYKAHNGVDYGAPRGTPIRAVGDGRILKIGRFGGSGKMIVLEHMAGYKTKYLHMSRFARGMRRGRKVLQGQIIGYVGSTGFATGPHLHFEMWKYRRVMDPLKVNLPASDPVPKTLITDFRDFVVNINETVAQVHRAPASEKNCCDKNPLQKKTTFID